MKKETVIAVLFAIAAIQPAWAQEGKEAAPQPIPQEAIPQKAPPPPPQEGSDAAPAAMPSGMPEAALAVPKLKITWDCGGCEHNHKVPPLIEQAYAAEASKHSRAISETNTAEVTITDLRQRPPGVRVMFGVMAGKDRLGVRIRYLGREYVASDTSANALMGLNYLSESVGKKAYAELTAAMPAR